MNRLWPTCRVSDITVDRGPEPAPDDRARHIEEHHEGHGQPGRRRAIVHVVFAVVGAIAMTLLVRSVGPGALVAALRGSARWLPLILALELGRLATEVWLTWSLSDRVRAHVPLAELTRTQVVGYGVANVMPAGRAAGEAVKAAMLTRFLGAAEATAIAASNQSTAMLGGALAAVPCVLAALWITGISALSGALAVFVLVSLVIVVAFQIACRRRGVGGAVLRRLTKMEDASAAFESAIDRIPYVPKIPTLAALTSRLLFVTELGVLLHATSGSAGVGRTMLAFGVSLVGGAVGDMVPGQLGASDGAFAVAAPILGITAANGVAIAMTLHVVQLGWGLVGWTLPLVWKSSSHRDEGPLSAGV